MSKIENDNDIYRSSKTFTYSDRELDSAMMLLEEVANYNYGNASHSFTDLIVDSVSYSLTVDTTLVNGHIGIEGTDQQRIRDSILAQITSYPSRVDTSNFNDHDLIFIDITDWSLNGTSLSFYGNIGIGELEARFVNADCDGPLPYTSGDDWIWGQDAGKCDQSVTESDAAQEMEKRLNYQRSSVCRLSPCNQGNEYFKNIVVSDIQKPSDHVNPNDPNPGDGIKDYLLFLGNGRTCVYNDEMEFHTGGAVTIANKSTVHPGGGRIIISYDLIPTVILVPDPPVGYPHFLKVYYGELSCR